jgi:hypothetical protein
MRALKMIAPALAALIVALAGCALGDNAAGVKNYRGASPLGDYVSVDLDLTASVVSFHNYTTNQSYGPYSFSKVTDPQYNLGFNIIYQTEVIADYPQPDCYARFGIMDGVTLIYQMMDNAGTPSDLSDDATVGYPCYAYFYDRNFTWDSCKGEAVNHMNQKMSANADNSEYEVGFTAMDNDAPGTMYRAVFSNKGYINAWPGYVHGVKGGAAMGGPQTIGDFVFDPTRDAYTILSVPGYTCIPTASGDFVYDFGPNNGAGFAIRQAAVKDWQTVYNGDFFVLAYNTDDPGQTKPFKMVLSGNGDCNVYDPHSSTPDTPVFSTPPLTSFEDWTGGPDGNKLTDLYQSASGCASAQSSTAQDACLCHGAFVWDSGSGYGTFVILMDPEGNFCYVARFVNGTSFSYGYGIKDRP